MALRFVTAKEMKVESHAWSQQDWLSRPDIVEAENLLLVRVHIPPGQGHAFHRHPEMEEIIYILSGTCEQWVEKEKRILGAGEIAHIPKNVVHCSFNIGADGLQVLAILSPARITGPALVDVSQEEPWRSMRGTK